MFPFWKRYDLTTDEIARCLLGCCLVSESPEGTTAGWIVETEAYFGVADRAGHCFRGRQTPRLRAFYTWAGTIYTYVSHGHVLMNMITQSPDQPQGVLIRAVEPEQGQELMQKRRSGKSGVSLTNGPGKLTQAMGISMDNYGSSILDKPVYLDLQRRRFPKKIAVSSRIGVPNKGRWTDAPFRYYVEGNPYVSRPKSRNQPQHGWRNLQFKI